jgi:hypothetical protein
MYGVQIVECGKWQARTMMRLRRKQSDASKRKPGRQVFSESEGPLFGGAGLQARRLVQIARAAEIQWHGTSHRHLCLNQAIKSDARTSRDLWQR